MAVTDLALDPSLLADIDNDLNWKANYTTVGNPWGVCVSGGPGPKNPGKQYLYSTNSWPVLAATAQPVHREIYKMELDGTIIGKFRQAEASGGILDHSSNGLPRSECHLHRRDQQLAFAEDSAQAAGSQVDLCELRRR